MQNIYRHTNLRRTLETEGRSATDYTPETLDAPSTLAPTLFPTATHARRQTSPSKGGDHRIVYLLFLLNHMPRWITPFREHLDSLRYCSKLLALPSPLEGFRVGGRQAELRRRAVFHACGGRRRQRRRNARLGRPRHGNGRRQHDSQTGRRRRHHRRRRRQPRPRTPL